MMNNKKNAIVCGVNFGEFYIRALYRNSEVSLGGILSRGSEKSRKLAEKYDVPLFTDADEIPRADAVIMAARSMITGGRSSAAVKKLLNKGIPVLQEQPVHYNEVTDILSSSPKDAKYGVNNFYRYLPAVDAFIKYAQKLHSERKILRYRMSCASQVLYPLMDVLYSVSGCSETFSASKVSSGAMTVITGEINGIPYVIDYYNEYTEDIDSSLALFFDIKIDTDGGNLILTDPVGDVIWQSHLSCSRNADNNSDRYRCNIPLKRLYTSDVKNYSELYNEVWVKAMERSVSDFFDSESQAVKSRTLRQCEMCSIITSAAGMPVRIEIPYTDSVTL